MSESMPALTICLAAQDPPDGPVVLLSREGMGKVHLANESRDGARCGVLLDDLTSGWLRPPVDWGHSDLCSRCLRARDE